MNHTLKLLTKMALGQHTDSESDDSTCFPSLLTPETDDFFCNPPENEAAFEFSKNLERERNKFRMALEKIAECDDHGYFGEDDGPELARRLRSSVITAEEALAEPNVKCAATGSEGKDHE